MKSLYFSHLFPPKRSWVVNTNDIFIEKNFSHSRWPSQTSFRQLLNQTIHLSFRVNRPKLSNSNALFQFMTLALFRAKRLQSLFLPCRCYKRRHHNFIAQRSLTAPEAGLTLNIRHVHLAPRLINNRKAFTMPLRWHHHLICLAQQVHSDNRRYGRASLTERIKNNLVNTGRLRGCRFGLNWLLLKK